MLRLREAIPSPNKAPLQALSGTLPRIKSSIAKLPRIQVKKSIKSGRRLALSGFVGCAIVPTRELFLPRKDRPF